mmetsp:Transcript_49312/g.139618  ORF Transcript_49312/g.139618 Transcript_49312/m.139618 type:complete len:520 (+) Transcript_49312:1558-3117(+)
MAQVRRHGADLVERRLRDAQVLAPDVREQEFDVAVPLALGRARLGRQCGEGLGVKVGVNKDVGLVVADALVDHVAPKALSTVAASADLDEARRAAAHLDFGVAWPVADLKRVKHLLQVDDQLLSERLVGGHAPLPVQHETGAIGRLAVVLPEGADLVLAVARHGVHHVLDSREVLLHEHRLVDLAEAVALAHDVAEGGLHLVNGLAQRDVVRAGRLDRLDDGLEDLGRLGQLPVVEEGLNLAPGRGLDLHDRAHAGRPDLLAHVILVAARLSARRAVGANAELLREAVAELDARFGTRHDREDVGEAALLQIGDEVVEGLVLVLERVVEAEGRDEVELKARGHHVGDGARVLERDYAHDAVAALHRLVSDHGPGREGVDHNHARVVIRRRQLTRGGCGRLEHAHAVERRHLLHRLHVKVLAVHDIMVGEPLGVAAALHAVCVESRRPFEGRVIQSETLGTVAKGRGRTVVECHGLLERAEILGSRAGGRVDRGRGRQVFGVALRGGGGLLVSHGNEGVS